MAEFVLRPRLESEKGEKLTYSLAAIRNPASRTPPPQKKKKKKKSLAPDVRNTSFRQLR